MASSLTAATCTRCSRSAPSSGRSSWRWGSPRCRPTTTLRAPSGTSTHSSSPSSTRHVTSMTPSSCEVLGVSVDSQFTHLAWINTPRKEGGLGPLNIPLLADVTRKLSSDYGVLKEDEGIAYRGLFVIDGKGVLRQVTINDLPVGRSVDEALRLVQAFQYTDEHGEVCPAGWTPGSDTIKPNVDDSKEYFSKHN
uniref:thioredoxin-dependent peroxiredoxin n=1 Tax=Bos indicus x Bos taurus TaxID=30522 RepID=A0A4W2F2B7_BOBOX